VDVPVSAPAKGATPVGKLCVSAVRIGCSVIQSAVRSMDEAAVGSVGFEFQFKDMDGKNEK
jgi:hypothetical protein